MYSVVYNPISHEKWVPGDPKDCIISTPHEGQADMLIRVLTAQGFHAELKN